MSEEKKEAKVKPVFACDWDHGIECTVWKARYGYSINVKTTWKKDGESHNARVNVWPNQTEIFLRQIEDCVGWINNQGDTKQEEKK